MFDFLSLDLFINPSEQTRAVVFLTANTQRLRGEGRDSCAGERSLGHVSS